MPVRLVWEVDVVECKMTITALEQSTNELQSTSLYQKFPQKPYIAQGRVVR